MYDVITIGAATRDVFIRSKAIETHAASHSPTGIEACLPLGSKVPIDDIHFTSGGGATNAAVTFARLGKLRTAALCEIGRDDPGAVAVLGDLKRERVDTRLIQRDPKLATAYSVILVAGSGERTVLVYRGASQRLIAAQIPWSKLRARWFYLTSLGGDLALAKRILAHAERVGARVAWNPGGAEIAHGWKRMAPLIARCDVFNLNREEAAALTKHNPKDLSGIMRAICGTPVACEQCGPSCDTCEAMSAACSPYLLITDGSGGAYVRTGGTTWHIASRGIKVVNTTGAGDAFGSAFVLGLTLGKRKDQYGFSLSNALRLAMANAEGVITHMGAKTGILNRAPSRAALAKYHVRLWPPSTSRDASQTKA